MDGIGWTIGCTAGLDVKAFASRDEEEVTGYADVMETVIEQSKDAYYLALRQTQETIRSTEPDWQPWLVFFLKSLQKQKARFERHVRISAQAADIRT